MKALAGELQFEEGPRGRGRRHPDFKPGFVAQNHLESLSTGPRANLNGVRMFVNGLFVNGCS